MLNEGIKEAVEGNTKPKGTSTEHKKGGNRYRNWVFTLNNYKKENIDQIMRMLVQGGNKFTFQEEKGENGTEHLQGVIHFNKAMRFETLKKDFMIYGMSPHLERCINLKASIEYCSKEDTRNGMCYSNQKRILNDPMSDKIWKRWQLYIKKIVEGPISDRKIYWFWSDKGNIGKSTFAKHLVIKYKALLIGSGMGKDLRYAISKYLEDNDLKIVVIDIPRHRKNNVNFDALEEIKNGMFFSSKYESGMCVFNSPHIICFSNYKPDFQGSLSPDRFENTVFEIRHNN